MSNDLIDQVISVAFMNQYVYSKVAFDNASDTQKMLDVAQQNAEMAVTAAKERLIPRLDELLEKKLRSIIDDSDGQVAITLGNGEFTLIKITEAES